MREGARQQGVAFRTGNLRIAPPSFSSSPLHTPIWLPKVSAVIPALPRFTLIDPRTNTTQRSPEHSPYPFPPLSITSIAKPPRVREN